jgi:hypothetical protein
LYLKIEYIRAKMVLNTKYWCVGKGYKYFDEYAFETIRRDCLEEIQTIKFKYPNRCNKIDGEWKQYLGAGRFCDPQLKG